jgi:hypothetical protein
MRERIVNLNRNLLPITLWAAIALALTACPSTPVKNSSGSNNSNTSAVTPSASATEQMSASANSDPVKENASLATPTDAYKTAFAIRQRKDSQALRRVLSKEILEFFTEMGKAEGKSLDEMLKDLTERPQAGAPETRNEKINGNRATLEYKDEKGEWEEMDFEKEGGEWKLTLPKAEGPNKPADVPGKKP